MPTAIRPMLAVSVEKPFDDPEWLYEIKWDGYRAVSFIEDGRVRLVSRNQNDLTGEFPELRDLSKLIKTKNAILDGEVVALDEHGRASFSLMQQRTGIRKGGRRVGAHRELQVVYYLFDLIYLDGYDLRRVDLEQRKQALSQIIAASELVRYSEHFPEGLKLFEAAKKQGLEGILAKKRRSCYEERRSRDWLKIKVTQTVDCVIGGYTDPEGQPAIFRIDCPRSLRQARASNSRGAGGNGIQSGNAERNLATAQGTGNQSQSVLRQSGRGACALAETGASGRNQIFRVDA